MNSQYSWDDHDSRTTRWAALLTIGVQVVVVVVLLVFGFVTPLPLPGEEGIAVSFGTERGGRNAPIPAVMQAQPMPRPPTPQNTPQPKAPEQQLTQDFEEAPEIHAPKPQKRTEPTKPKEQPTQPTPKPPQESKPEQPERKVNQDALFSGKAPSPTQEGTGTGGEAGNQGTYEGTTTGTGAGKGTGQGTGGTGKGQGPGGSGISYSIGNRVAQQLPSPAYPTQKSGRVVVKVWVSRQGRVTKAEPGEPGTTTFDAALHEAAKAAALQATFDASADAPAVQVGTITYIFKLKQ